MSLHLLASVSSSALKVPQAGDYEILVLELDASQNIASNTSTSEGLVWGATAVADTASVWSGVSTADVEIPNSWTRYQVFANCRWAAGGSNSGVRLRATVNGSLSPLYGGDNRRNVNSNSTSRQNMASGIIQHSGGAVDTIRVEVTHNHTTAKNVLKDSQTWVAVVKHSDQAMYTHSVRDTTWGLSANTLSYIPYDGLVTDRPRWVSGVDSFQTNRASKRFHVIATNEWNTIASGSTFLNIDKDGGSLARGPALELDVGLGSSDYGSIDSIMSAPVYLGGLIQAQARHNSPLGARDLQIESFTQVALEPEGVSSACLRVGSDFTVPHASVTAIPYDTLVYEDDAGFTTGASGTLTIPAGSWSFGLVFAGQPCAVEDGASTDTFMRVETDTGGGFGPGIGNPARMARTSQLERTRFSMVGVLPSPTAGDVLRATLWQNSGASQTAVAGNSSYFSIQLFPN